MVIHFLFTLFTFSLFVSPAPALPEIKTWCSQTPNPHTCEFFLAKNPKYGQTLMKQKADFLMVSLQLALDSVMEAQTHIQKLGGKCRNDREKAAWDDCEILYEYTIQNLKRIVDPNPNFSQDDAQTWLSTALTNLETCKSGFIEVGVTNNIMPLIFKNASELVSNSLALNKVSDLFGNESSYKEGFPTWVSPGDQKSPSWASQANIVVAVDGSGTYSTINEAIGDAATQSYCGRLVIYVKEGTYMENVNVGNLTNIVLVGDGIGKTVITADRSNISGFTILNSPTFAVVGHGFIAQGITFRNTAGPENYQAVALLSGSDLSVFYQCSFEGYQDTLFVYSNRQFYRECDIYGTIDFIFGNAAVVFQNCNIYARNTPSKVNTITAQGRFNPNQTTGISVHNCIVTGAPDLIPVLGTVTTYLGRPWQSYSRTIFIKTFLDGLIDPAGWMPWYGESSESTLYYGEFMNTGPGSSTSNRVTWEGYHAITSESEASEFTVGSFISGDSWLPETNVPFISGL